MPDPSHERAAHWSNYSDEDLIELVAPANEDIAYAHATRPDVAQLEMVRRLTVALREHKVSSDLANRWLLRLTIVLVALTVVLVALTVVIVLVHA